MFERFTEVVALDAPRGRAERILGLHPLTAADALQLAAALTLVSDRPRRRGFVTCHDRLAAAASDEGFQAIVPT
jgi:predicted nucleic acid-binding protein